MMKSRRFAAILCVLLLLTSALAPMADAYPLLTLGSSGTTVLKLQHRLVAAGFLSGQTDGVYGERTRKAVLAFQQALAGQGHQLKADGIAGPVTLQLVYDEEVMRPFIDFSLGTTGQRVIVLQNRLIDLKFLEGSADGVLGDKTRDALLSFQRQLASFGADGITESGAADQATREWLTADLSGFSIRAPEFFNDQEPLALTDEYLNSQAGILVNAATGEVLYAKQPEIRMFPASTTKLMTLLLAVEQGGLDQVVTLPGSVSDVPRDSSLVPVYPGEKMPMRDLLHGMMLRSGNDAANAVAVLTAGSLDAFVSLMNTKAAQLGMRDTHFMNPHGYHDPEHYTTARDLVTLAMYAMRQTDVAAIASALTYDMSPTSKRGVQQVVNNNELLNPLSRHYYQGAYGIKSGYTNAAGFCYVGAARRGGDTLYAVILHSRTRSQGWADMKHLFNFGFARLGQVMP
jgi:D-alanyl-D-alanine carboxypeptidase (penicillin-binding protein 5/6)